MILMDVIEELKRHHPAKVIRFGWDGAYSDRGYYDELSFHPARDVTIAKMREVAESCIGAKMHGYKGGEYTMGGYTNCHVGEYGECGDELNRRLLAFMLGEEPIWTFAEVAQAVVHQGSASQEASDE